MKRLFILLLVSIFTLSSFTMAPEAGRQVTVSVSSRVSVVRSDSFYIRYNNRDLLECVASSRGYDIYYRIPESELSVDIDPSRIIIYTPDTVIVRAGYGYQLREK